MNGIKVTFLFVVIFALCGVQIASAQCPTLEVFGPSSDVRIGEQLTFSLSVNGGDPKVTPKIKWFITDGKIKTGQGSVAITVDTAGLTADSLTATAEVEGYAQSCPFSSGSTAYLVKPSVPRKFDEYGIVNNEEELVRLDGFVVAIQSDPTAKGYVFVYSGKKSKPAANKAAIKRIQTYIVKTRGMDASRIVIKNGGRKDLPLRELWLVPDGSKPPDPTPITTKPPTPRK